ncbi:MAG: hypothetical protein KAY96_03005, partial [Bacteroidia bacterium]|nr:hypothetical protein [Bacteroidia bacterium]
MIWPPSFGGDGEGKKAPSWVLKSCHEDTKAPSWVLKSCHEDTKAPSWVLKSCHPPSADTTKARRQQAG